jgi:hypothetical protein
MKKISKKGYVLFEYSNKEINFGEYCSTRKELNNRHNNHLGDKWDLEGRQHIHYFYLDIKTGEYIPLGRWKNDYDPKLKYEQCEKTTPSRTF